ncbi:hypothetical protein C1H46_007360 [Malus baccata]|uniref:Uncharacterized protein n=1 Tax=Malus baccata TaxID=106549 RepID=A0A540N8Z4_MALBA|nr:hypothetical protein C1H46_007360 [Malus baccata]
MRAATQDTTGGPHKLRPKGCKNRRTLTLSYINQIAAFVTYSKEAKLRTKKVDTRSKSPSRTPENIYKQRIIQVESEAKEVCKIPNTWRRWGLDIGMPVGKGEVNEGILDRPPIRVHRGMGMEYHN